MVVPKSDLLIRGGGRANSPNYDAGQGRPLLAVQNGSILILDRRQETHMTTATTLEGEVTQDFNLEPVFRIELQYTEGADECAPIGLKDGVLVGSGNGVIEGPRLRGTLSYSNYENTTPRLCTMQVPMIVKTDDGAEIRLEARGYAMVPDESQPARWRIAGVLRFETRDERYLWLNAHLAPYEGEFDAETGQGTLRAYLPPAN